MESFNGRIVSFPDGIVRLHFSTHAYKVKSDKERELDKKAREWEQQQKAMLEQADWVSFAEQYAPLHDFKGRPVFINEKGYAQLIDDKSIFEPKEINLRKKADNMKRAVQKVYDIARSNLFTHFITLTFDPEKVDSYDYSACCFSLLSFTKLLNRHGCTYILVPERHESGRYHFHGLITLGSLSLSRATSPYDGSMLSDEQGRPIFNLSQYSLGFSTATEISDPAKTASYLSKYLTKELSVPKGKKCYWASRSCFRPTVERVNLLVDDLAPYVENARYIKVINNDYGDFLIAEKEKG